MVLTSLNNSISEWVIELGLEASNNKAEYEALIIRLQMAIIV